MSRKPHLIDRHTSKAGRSSHDHDHDHDSRLHELAASSPLKHALKGRDPSSRRNKQNPLGNPYPQLAAAPSPYAGSAPPAHRAAPPSAPPFPMPYAPDGYPPQDQHHQLSSLTDMYSNHSLDSFLSASPPPEHSTMTFHPDITSPYATDPYATPASSHTTTSFTPSLYPPTTHHLDTNIHSTFSQLSLHSPPIDIPPAHTTSSFYPQPTPTLAARGTRRAPTTPLHIPPATPSFAGSASPQTPPTPLAPHPATNPSYHPPRPDSASSFTSNSSSRSSTPRPTTAFATIIHNNRRKEEDRARGRRTPRTLRPQSHYPDPFGTTPPSPSPLSPPPFSPLSAPDTLGPFLPTVEGTSPLDPSALLTASPPTDLFFDAPGTTPPIGTPTPSLHRPHHPQPHRYDAAFPATSHPLPHLGTPPNAIPPRMALSPYPQHTTHSFGPLPTDPYTTTTYFPDAPPATPPSALAFALNQPPQPQPQTPALFLRQPAANNPMPRLPNPNNGRHGAGASLPASPAAPPSREGSLECCICENNARELLFMPCTHCCCCRSCARLLGEPLLCPVCRQHVDHQLPVRFP